ncbi:hypothetical protein INS49_004515 [Diaporthe citri]|uniref:uncharacterized protein n=1 Tax=Diaporthe citri TaxID=83186 RepID=UPI001C8041B9|nr:uncharacterized protein INS49_004515 [Diaporthe citri]KAG6354498.1 hypothetical protein INS49_004515 [Diaporthe citri]
MVEDVVWTKQQRRHNTGSGGNGVVDNERDIGYEERHTDLRARNCHRDQCPENLLGHDRENKTRRHNQGHDDDNERSYPHPRSEQRSGSDFGRPTGDFWVINLQDINDYYYISVPSPEILQHLIEDLDHTSACPAAQTVLVEDVSDLRALGAAKREERAKRRQVQERQDLTVDT